MKMAKKVKTYRASERGYYHLVGGGFALAEDGEVFTTDSPQGSWMEETDAPDDTMSIDDGPDYASLKLPDLALRAKERDIAIPADIKGQELKKHLIEALEAADA
jgi:hypothetical protein